MIVHADGDPSAGPYSASGKECREPGRLVVELTPAEDRAPVDDGGVSGEEGGPPFERGGDRGVGAHPVMSPRARGDSQGLPGQGDRDESRRARPRVAQDREGSWSRARLGSCFPIVAGNDAGQRLACAMIERMLFTGSELRIIGLTVVAVVAAAVTYYGHIGGTIAPFVLAGVALALLASLVGRSVEAMGERLGAGATGVVQSALGNLPELFVVLFALKSKLYEVATATIVGSILANVLLVLGLAFIAGGAKHGVQHFEQTAARRMSLMMLLSVAALVVPALTSLLHTPAAGHERALSIAVSILLLLLFIGSLPASIKKSEAETAHATGSAPGAGGHDAGGGWPLWLALTMLAVTGVAAAFV